MNNQEIPQRLYKAYITYGHMLCVPASCKYEAQEKAAELFNRLSQSQRPPVVEPEHVEVHEMRLAPEKSLIKELGRSLNDTRDVAYELYMQAEEGSETKVRREAEVNMLTEVILRIKKLLEEEDDER